MHALSYLDTQSFMAVLSKESVSLRTEVNISFSVYLFPLSYTSSSPIFFSPFMYFLTCDLHTVLRQFVVHQHNSDKDDDPAFLEAFLEVLTLSLRY